MSVHGKSSETQCDGDMTMTGKNDGTGFNVNIELNEVYVPMSIL